MKHHQLHSGSVAHSNPTIPLWKRFLALILKLKIENDTSFTNVWYRVDQYDYNRCITYEIVYD